MSGLTAQEIADCELALRTACGRLEKHLWNSGGDPYEGPPLETLTLVDLVRLVSQYGWEFR